MCESQGRNPIGKALVISTFFSESVGSCWKWGEIIGDLLGHEFVKCKPLLNITRLTDEVCMWFVVIIII